MKIDIEKLICFLMSDEVIENNIPESLKLGLKEQGYKYEDGKICPLQEEPVSEDLKEASRNYADNEEYGDDVYFAIKAAFEAGAKWQKEQMMAKAIDAHCFGFQGAALFSFRLPVSNYLVGSEVKVIVIKED